MALFCSNCGRQIAYVSDMTRHVTDCLKDAKDTGAHAGHWAKAQTSPKFMFENYFTTVDPRQVVVAQPIEEMTTIDNLKERDTILAALDHPGVRLQVKSKLSDVLEDPRQLRVFNWRDFQKRMGISAQVSQAGVFYRKMSDGEWAAVVQAKNPFRPTFSYTNTDNYRYWVSSSLAKVEAFGNENSSDAGGVIVELRFKSAAFAKYKIKAHQQRGVQNEPASIAMHREGFAEFGCSFDNDLCVTQVMEQNLDFNLGFTSSHLKELTDNLASYKRM